MSSQNAYSSLHEYAEKFKVTSLLKQGPPRRSRPPDGPRPHDRSRRICPARAPPDWIGRPRISSDLHSTDAYVGGYQQFRQGLTAAGAGHTSRLRAPSLPPSTTDPTDLLLFTASVCVCVCVCVLRNSTNCGSLWAWAFNKSEGEGGSCTLVSAGLAIWRCREVGIQHQLILIRSRKSEDSEPVAS